MTIGGQPNSSNPVMKDAAENISIYALSCCVPYAAFLGWGISRAYWVALVCRIIVDFDGCSVGFTLIGATSELGGSPST